MQQHGSKALGFITRNLNNLHHAMRMVAQQLALCREQMQQQGRNLRSKKAVGSTRAEGYCRGQRGGQLVHCRQHTQQEGRAWNPENAVALARAEVL
eukprot:1137954-Pelagomonas_calceolata.AAC.2